MRTQSFCMFLLFLLISHQKILLENGLNSTEMMDKRENLLNDVNDVLVETQQSVLFREDNLQKVFLSFKSLHRSKKQAYQNFLKKWNAINKKLLKHHLIPNEQTIIKSKIRQKYHQKAKKWEFSQIFVLICSQEESDEVLSLLESEHVERISSQKDVNYLNEKLIALRAFNAAKREVQAFLKDDLGSNLKILYTKDIQIIGRKLENKEILEQEIEKQYNEGNLLMTGKDQFEEGKQNKKEVISKIKVLFKIGVPPNEEDDEADSDQSISEFTPDLQELSEDL